MLAILFRSYCVESIQKLLQAGSQCAIYLFSNDFMGQAEIFIILVMLLAWW